MKDGKLVQAINFESYGTYLFINTLPMFCQVLKKVGTIVMDDFDTVEHSDETNCRELYSLSDFGFKGTNARKGKDYMNNYFMGKYGAIRDIDLSDIFKKFVENGDAPITK